MHHISRLSAPHPSWYYHKLLLSETCYRLLSSPSSLLLLNLQHAAWIDETTESSTGTTKHCKITHTFNFMTGVFLP